MGVVNLFGGKMSHVEMISADTLKSLIAEGSVSVIDVRDNDEFRREHIEQACCIPADKLSKSTISDHSKGAAVVFHCQSGVRTQQLLDTIKELGLDRALILQGGLASWKKCDGKVVVDKNARLPLMRQVQVIVGAMVLLGIILSYLVSPYFNLLSAFFGAGLLFAGLSGFCGLARILMCLPYNKT
jgi:rhodanese-related sulfurtransferase